MLSALSEKFQYYFGPRELRPKKRILERDYSDDGDSDIENKLHILEPALKRSRYNLHNGELDENKPSNSLSSVYNPTTRRSIHIDSIYNTLSNCLSSFKWNATDRLAERDYRYHTNMTKNIDNEERLSYIPPKDDLYSSDEPQYLKTSRVEKPYDNGIVDNDPVEYLGTSPHPLRHLRRSISGSSPFPIPPSFKSPSPSHMHNGIDSTFRFSPSITSTAIRSSNDLSKRGSRALHSIKSTLTKEFPILRNKNMFTQRSSNYLPNKPRKPYESYALNILRKNSANSRESYRLEEKLNYQKLLEQHAKSDVASPTFKFSLSPATDSSIGGDLQLLDVKSCGNALIKDKPTLIKSLKNRNSILELRGRPSIHSPQKNTTNQQLENDDKTKEETTSSEKGKDLQEQHSPEESTKKESEDDLEITAVISAPRGRNSLEEKLKDSVYYRHDWLQNFKAERQAKKEAVERELQAASARTKKLEETRKLNEKSLEDRVAERISLLDLTFPPLIKDLPAEDTALVPLTDEMENFIDYAFRGGSANEVLADKFNIQVTRRDIATLSGLNWLNDEVVNFYMNLLMERGKNDNFLNVYAFNTFFYPKLMKNGFSSIKRWTKKVNVFAQDLLLVPVHLGMHWCLATIDMRTKTIRYYDSMLGDNHNCLQGLMNYLVEEHQDKLKSSFNSSGWSCENIKDIPQQMNGSDCGMFACKFAEYLSRDVEITFDQELMPYFRRRMVYEIVKAKLL